MTPRRLIDIIASSSGLLLAAPVMAAAALAVKLTMGGPVIFKQTRVGLGNRPFTIYKFRSMLNAADSNGDPLPDEQRVTKTGHFLRAASLDELPQLFNILNGNMSLVGPRPLLERDVRDLPSYRKLFNAHKPGLTGRGQVNRMRVTKTEEMGAKELAYYDERTLWTDLKLVLRTPWALVATRNQTGANPLKAVFAEAAAPDTKPDQSAQPSTSARNSFRC